MDQHVAIREAFQLLPIVVDMAALIVEAGAGEFREVVVCSNSYAAPFQDLSIVPGSDEPHWSLAFKERRNARLAAGRDSVPRIAWKAEPQELLLHRFGRSGRIGYQDGAAALAPPLPEPVRGTREEGDSIVDDSPDVAQDEPVALRESIKIAHSSPAWTSARSIGSTSSGLLSSRRANGGGLTSTTSTGTPAARKRSCSSPSSNSSSAGGVRT